MNVKARMHAGLAALLLCVDAAPSRAQVEFAPEILILDHIKARMAENLRRLPDYTCTEVIDRSRRRRGTDTFAPVDTLKLDVALVDGKEVVLPAGRRFAV